MTEAVNQRSAEVEALAKPGRCCRRYRTARPRCAPRARRICPQWPAEERRHTAHACHGDPVSPAYRRTVA